MTSSATLPGRKTDRATLPLRFTIFRECLNEDVMVAIIDALADKSCSDQCLAAIFKNACLYQYQIELNQIIKNIEKLHGAGTVTVNENVIDMLAPDQIKLVQNSDGTVELEKTNPVHQDPKRHEMIDSTLGHLLPAALCKLIGGYDDEFEICEKNKVDIKNYLLYGKPAEKRLILIAAVHQKRMPVLNEMLRELNKIRKFCVDFSYMDLRNLDLTGIDLSSSNLTGADLQDTCLVNAVLVGASLRCAKLNNANLGQAILSFADLSRARLIAANLSGATLLNTNGQSACLFCANLQGVSSHILRNFGGAAFNYSNFKISSDEIYNPEQFNRVDAPVHVQIVSAMTSRTKSFFLIDQPRAMHVVVIDEMEKNILLAKGILFHDVGNGIVQLRRPVALFQDPLRNLVIDSTLRILPKVLTDIISAYENEIEISEINESAILDILKTGDPAAKGQIISAASGQKKILFLNELFKKLRVQGITLNLSHIDVSNLDLRDINLTNANLSHAVMHGCDLSRAVLRQANLNCANLNGAILIRARFDHASMNDARLLGADLSSAILFKATLVRAILKFANLNNAKLRGGADLSGAYLDYANLQDASLHRAKMMKVSLTHANLQGVDLGLANLTNAKLMHARIIGANLSGGILTEADLTSAIFEQVRLKGWVILAGMNWKNVRAKKIDADPAVRIQLPFLLRLKCI